MNATLNFLETSCWWQSLSAGLWIHPSISRTLTSGHWGNYWGSSWIHSLQKEEAPVISNDEKYIHFLNRSHSGTTTLRRCDHGIASILCVTLLRRWDLSPTECTFSFKQYLEHCPGNSGRMLWVPRLAFASLDKEKPSPREGKPSLNKSGCLRTSLLTLSRAHSVSSQPHSCPAAQGGWLEGPSLTCLMAMRYGGCYLTVWVSRFLQLYSGIMKHLWWWKQ